MGTAPWWLDPGFIAFDTETTGIDSSRDRIVTAAAVHFVNGQPRESREWLFRVDVPIPARATEVHGITNEASQREGMDQAEGLSELRSYLQRDGLPIVAFNASFDVDMLKANLTRLRLDTGLNAPVICPHVIDKHFNKYVRGSNQRRLQPTAQRYGLAIADDEWHGALADATVTGQILLAQMTAFAALQSLSARRLATEVQGWRVQQEADFQAWLARRQ